MKTCCLLNINNVLTKCLCYNLLLDIKKKQNTPIQLCNFVYKLLLLHYAIHSGKNRLYHSLILVKSHAILCYLSYVLVRTAFNKLKGHFHLPYRSIKGFLIRSFMMNLDSCKIHYKLILEIINILNQIKMNFVDHGIWQMYPSKK